MMERPSDTEWRFGLIDESAQNVQKTYFVYVGFIAYGVLTVLTSSDRELVLNSSVNLPIVGVQASLTAFYLVGPLLAVLMFMHLQIGLVELRRLLLQVPIDPEAPRIYPWIVARSILLLNGKLSWQFTDRLQVALTIVSAYASLPIALVIFSIGYARVHAPTMSFVIGALPIVGAMLSLAFYLEMIGSGSRPFWEIIRPKWPLLIAPLIIGAVPYDVFDLIFSTMFIFIAGIVLVLFQFALVAIVAALIVAAVILAKRTTPVREGLRKAWRTVDIWLLLAIVLIATVVMVAEFEYKSLLNAFVPLAIAPLILTVAYAMGAMTTRGSVTASFLFIVIALYVGLIRLLWLSNSGDGINVNLSYQVLSTQAKEGESAHIPPLDLSGIHMEGGKLRFAILDRALLRNARLAGADLTSADLDGADLSDADLRGTDLSRSSLKNAALNNAKLGQTRFEGADLRGAGVKGVSLAGAVYFRGTQLDGADLSSSDFASFPMFDLTVEQLLTTKTLQYAQLPDSLYKAIIARSPKLIFGTGEANLFDQLSHLTEVLLYTHPDGSQFTRTQLHSTLVFIPWEIEHAPDWKREAYVNYFGQRAIEILTKADLLRQTGDDTFTIPQTSAVAAARAKFPTQSGASPAKATRPPQPAAH
jgi:uncharacterized protein YjbI with pentapeptide repeats